MNRSRIGFIFIIISTLYLIYYNFPPTINHFHSSKVNSKVFINLNTTYSSSSAIISTTDKSIKEKYIINTESCKMLAWPLFDNETRPVFRNHSGQRLNCHLYDKKLINAKRVNETILSVEWITKTKPVPQCYATEILHIENFDSIYQFGSTYGPITRRTNLPKSDRLRVRCYRSKNSKSKIIKNKKFKIFDEVIPLIPNKKMKTNNYETVDKNTPNVLLLGIDSVSWLNFKRQFKLTEKLAEKHRFYPIYGYNKIGDNTFPNLMAMLTGEFYEKFWNESIRTKKYFDDLPFIWKDFANQNFITTLIEDLPKYSLFNYNRLGFMKEPTDYYLRPVSLAIEKHINRFCYKDYMEIEFYYNYTYDFVKAMHSRRQKYFAFVFMARLTHNNANYAGYADLPVYTLLSKLFDNNLLNDTVVILFSDHGIRFGKMRATASGRVEERLPFIYIYLPKALRTSKINKNLAINAHRLTTPFDIHSTLLHILKGHSVPNQSHGMSLFEEIPVNRSCHSENISEHWCTCTQHNRIYNYDNISSLANLIVSKINKLLKPVSSHCKKLELDKILSAFERKTSEDREKYYLITSSVKPSGAIFEATVILSSNQTKIVGEISRINEYGSQSYCINNSFLQKYCYC